MTRDLTPVSRISYRAQGYSTPISKEWISTLSSFLRDSRESINGAILLLAREVHGYPPVFALDFEIVHSYLFPSLQTQFARALPSVVSYVISSCPRNFVLPPGAVIELVRKLEQYHALRELLDKAVSESKGQENSKVHKDLASLVEAMSTTVGDPATFSYSAQQAESDDAVLRRVTEMFHHLTKGFERLDWLLRKRLTPIQHVYPRLNSVFDSGDMRQLHEELKARVNAHRGIHSRGNTYCDALNLATLIAFQNAETIDRPRQKKTSAQCMYLLTETASLARVNISDLSSDTVLEDICRRGQMNAEFTRGSDRSAWCVINLDAVMVYCAYRSAFSTAEDALSHAKRDFSELFELSGALLTLEERGISRIPSGIRAKLTRMFKAGTPKYRCVAPLLKVAEDKKSEVAFLRRLAVPAAQGQMVMVGQAAQIDGDAVVPAKYNRRGIAIRDLFGIRIRRQAAGSDGCKRLTIDSRYSQDALLIAYYWKNAQLLSFSWTIKAELDIVIATLSGNMSTAVGTGVFVAGYEPLRGFIDSPAASSKGKREARKVQPASGRDPNLHWRAIGGKSRVETPSLLSFVLPGAPTRTGAMFLLPEIVGLETQQGSIYVRWLSGSKSHEARVTCTTKSDVGIEIPVIMSEFLRTTHSLRSLPGVCEKLEEEVRDLF